MFLNDVIMRIGKMKRSPVQIVTKKIITNNFAWLTLFIYAVCKWYCWGKIHN